MRHSVLLFIASFLFFGCSLNKTVIEPPDRVVQTGLYKGAAIFCNSELDARAIRNALTKDFMSGQIVLGRIVNNARLRGYQHPPCTVGDNVVIHIMEPFGEYAQKYTITRAIRVLSIVEDDSWYTKPDDVDVAFVGLDGHAVKHYDDLWIRSDVLVNVKILEEQTIYE